MQIALFGTPFSEKFTKYIQHLVNRLESENTTMLIYEDYLSFLEGKIKFQNPPEVFNSHESLKQNTDFLFSIGGDGTLLKAVTLVRDSNIPVLGINAGRLGFISSVSADQLEIAINDVLKNKYEIKKRTLLCLETENKLFGNVNYALNEVAVVKKDTSSMIRIDAFLDDEFLNSYWADGLVIATPTGSTGYSLSCGGPVIMPKTKNFIITPVSPHNLNVRPLIISEDSKLTFSIESRNQSFLVSLDSRSQSIDNSVDLSVMKADFNAKLIRIKDISFLDTLRTKLTWGLDKRN